MYNKVYLHKTVIAASILFEAAIQLAIDHFNLVDKTSDLHRFVYLTDSILDVILSSNDPQLEPSQYYIKRLYNRELPKLVSEDIIYLKRENITKHLPGITIDNVNNKITWVGRLLSNDFASEFDIYDIHVTTKEGTIPFREYWQKWYPSYQVETYYIKRVYSLTLS
jgi:HD superfamily phosphohydrolase